MSPSQDAASAGALERVAERGAAEPRGQGGCRTPHGADQRGVQRRLGDKELDAWQSRGRGPGHKEDARQGLRQGGGTGWGAGEGRDTWRTEAQAPAGAQRGQDGPGRPGEEAALHWVWSGHTAFPGLGGPRRPCAHPPRGCWREGASTTGTMSPLPRQQISPFVDLGCYGSLIPHLRISFKLLLLTKHRGVSNREGTVG